MLRKIMQHARAGTLPKVVMTKVRHLTVGNLGRGDTYYGDEAFNYDAEREGKQYWDDQQKVAEELLGTFPDGITVLDVPFGTGRFVHVYAEKHMKVYGLEISADMIAAARETRGDLMADFDVRVGNALQLPFADQSVDLVVCFRFLTEIISLADARAVLDEIRRVTRDAALLDLGVRDAGLAPLDRLPRDKERMGVSLTEQQVREMLATAGFDVESTTPAYVSGQGHRVAFLCRARPLD